MSYRRRSLTGMELLKVGDRVVSVSGRTGSVTEIDGDNAVVEWDTGDSPGRYGRDEHHHEGGVLTLL